MAASDREAKEKRQRRGKVSVHTPTWSGRAGGEKGDTGKHADRTKRGRWPRRAKGEGRKGEPEDRGRKKQGCQCERKRRIEGGRERDSV